MAVASMLMYWKWLKKFLWGVDGVVAMSLIVTGIHCTAWIATQGWTQGGHLVCLAGCCL